jgi:hypothetical protein
MHAHSLPPQNIRVGDAVAIKGSRLLGTVTELTANGGHEQIVLKVTAVAGKSRKSKTARACQGAWVTCEPEVVARLTMPTN